MPRRRVLLGVVVVGALAVTIAVLVAEDDGTPAPLATGERRCAPPRGDNEDLDVEPVVGAPAEAPTAPSCTDLVVGDGDVVQDGDRVRVRVVEANGSEIDASWDGNGTVVTVDAFSLHWAHGLIGAREGGRREIVLPGGVGRGVPTVVVADVVEIVG